MHACTGSYSERVPVYQTRSELKQIRCGRALIPWQGKPRAVAACRRADQLRWHDPSAMKDDPVTEQQLVERCRNGHEGAFQELVDRYKNLVFALIARTVQDRSRAEDLAQDVFLRIHRGLPYFRGEARLSTWIYRIVANVCVQDHARGVPALSLDDGRVRPRVTPAATDRRFSDLELRDRLEKAIARLPANYRLLIAAHYLDGVRYDDLAEALQLPLGTVKTQLHRAKQQLRRLLETELK